MARLVNSGGRDPMVVLVNSSKMASRPPGVAQSKGSVNAPPNWPYLGRPVGCCQGQARRYCAGTGMMEARMLLFGHLSGMPGSLVFGGRPGMSAPDHCAGSRTTKRAPSTLGSLSPLSPLLAGAVRFSAQIVPPWPSTICLEIDKPRPEFCPKPCAGRSV